MPLSSGARSAKTELGSGGKERGGRLFIILVAVSLVLFTLSTREAGSGPLTAIRGIFQFVTTPIRLVGVGVTTPFRGLGNVVTNLTADHAALTDLLAENEELRARNAELQESVRASERLEELLQLRSTYSLQSTAARIISTSSDSWSNTVTIDKGSSAGIAVGMPVTDSKGAIGQVIEVSPGTAVVRLIFDENSSVSAMIQSSRAQGMLQGSADSTLRLNLIRTDQTVVVGDMVVTSGLGGVYPKGIPIGEVMSVEKSSGALYYDIVVSPLASLETYEEVLVITSITEDQRASAEDIASADAQDSEADAESARKNATSEAEAGTAEEQGSGENNTSENGEEA